MADTLVVRGSRSHSARAAAVCALAVALASLTGAVFPPGVWYMQLEQPAGTPPSIAFPIVWTLLYIAMAVAAWRVWRRAGIGGALTLFTLQLALNALWMPVAFGAHWLAGAAVVIAALGTTLAATIVAFWRIDRLASVLLWPYLAWVSYALYLNLGLAVLN